ncbi:MAG: hypothetical protein AB7U83_20080 [Vicinamibacterales bacterium]
MKRRTLIKSALGAMALRPRPAAGQAAFGDAHLERMRALAEAVLPQELGADGRQRALTAFMTWVRDYRADADGDHGYGHARPRRLPPSPALKYPAQLDDLDRRAGGAFADRPLADRQRAVTAAIDAADVRDLPRRPNGGHVATDLMAHYFNGSGANDLAYGRRIMRGACRGLDGSDERPAPLPTGGR